ncbi:melanoma-associated antigen B4-like [Arvicola amphibius]|uniref:melanoma-associated antigen B4-like n=1 Tax=Arvicola amphibius TaxID=1047088 RepID=UPI0018E3135A|nr:melanoma-associated antigen B4-like [Arvicola amphibius]
MPYYPHFSLWKVFQDAFEIYRLAEKEEDEEEEEEEEEEMEEEEEKEEEEEEEEMEEEEGKEEDEEEEEEEEEEMEEEEEKEEDEEEEEEEEEELEEEEEKKEEEEKEEMEEDEKEEEEDEAKEAGAATYSDSVLSTLSASLRFTLPSFCASPPSASSSCPPFWSSPDETEESVTRMLSISQSYRSSSSFTSYINLDEEYGSPEEESLNTSKLTDNVSAWQNLKKRKVTELVNLLLLKYRMKEPIQEVEMLGVVNEDHKKQFPAIFEEAAKCLEMIFGIDIKEDDPVSSSYILTNTLNLTYDDYNKRLPRNAFLIVILGVIFIEGDCASEESMWEFLNMIGIYDGKEHFIYGEPREFLTRDLVQQNYLKYMQVPESYPPRYVFLWGPRAYAETTKMKALEFLTKFTRREPMYFSSLYNEALRDEGSRNRPMED